MPSTERAPASARLGECCDIMRLVIARDVANGGHPRGFEVAPFFSLRNGRVAGTAVVYRFSKAKKTATGKFGRGTEFADVTYATVAHCPFCGAALKKVPTDG